MSNDLLSCSCDDDLKHSASKRQRLEDKDERLSGSCSQNWKPVEHRLSCSHIPANCNSLEINHTKLPLDTRPGDNSIGHLGSYGKATGNTHTDLSSEHVCFGMVCMRHLCNLRRNGH
jgi:hypothetical protein